MFKYLWLVGLAVATVVFADPILTPEANFLSIPGIPSLSTGWFAQATDTADLGFRYPRYMELIRLSAQDYRLLVMDRITPELGDRTDRFLTCFPVRPYPDISYGELVHSGGMPAGSERPVGMCLMQADGYFNPATDSLAVIFEPNAAVGVYAFDSATSKFALARSFTSDSLRNPVAVYWALGNYFFADDSANAVLRTDAAGNFRSSFGRYGLFSDGYAGISDLTGYVDAQNLIHLYASDPILCKLDHLTAQAGPAAMTLHSQVFRSAADSLVAGFFHAAPVPGLGVVALDRFSKRCFLWNGLDSLSNVSRETDDPCAAHDAPLHLWYLGGRVVVASIDSAYGGWSLRSYTLRNVPPDNPQPAPSGHWTLAMSPVQVTDKLDVSAGDTLIIDAGVQVLFGPEGCIRLAFGSVLLVHGTATSPVSFANRTAGQTWGGILSNGGSLEVDHANFTGFGSYGIFTALPSGVAPYPTIRLSHCHFDGTALAPGGDAVRLMGNPQVMQRFEGCTLEDIPHGRGFYMNGCWVKADSVTVSKCDSMTAYLTNVTGSFTRCRFEQRASRYGVYFHGTSCSPNFRCNYFHNISPLSGPFDASVYVQAGAAPSFGYENFAEGVSNVFEDDCPVLLEMNGTGNLPVIDNTGGNGPGGKNDFIQHKMNGYYVRWNNYGTLYAAKQQYWGASKPDSTRFYPDAAHFALQMYSPTAYGLCGGSAQPLSKPGDDPRSRGLDEGEDPADSLFMVALQLEIAEDFAAAQTLFRDLALHSSAYQTRWQSAAHVVSTQRHLDAQAGDAFLPDLIASLVAADSGLYASHVFGQRLLAGYRTDQGRFEDAIGLCLDLLTSGLERDDSLIVCIDLLAIQALQDPERAGPLAGRNRIPAALRTTSREDAMRREQALLDELATGETKAHTPGPLPTRYQLYQNYPNPFNPNTEIRFDLPENTRVTLKIFNTLGQEVVTLADEVRAAGQHTVLWNSRDAAGRDVASGLYIYQLRAGPFTDSKKMVLMK